MKWMLYIVVFIALVIGGTFLIGYALPARTTISRSIKMQQPPEAVFGILADVRRMAEWNRNTEKVEMLPSIGGKEATKQSFKGGMLITIITAESRDGDVDVRRQAGGRSTFRGCRMRHGFPAATTFSGRSFVTTEHAPTIARAPILIPGMTNARAPTKASSPIVIFATTSGMEAREKSWLPVFKYASCATTARAPISISPRLYTFARSPRHERSCNVRFHGTAMRARGWTKGVPSILASNTPSQKRRHAFAGFGVQPQKTNQQKSQSARRTRSLTGHGEANCELCV
jgi:hypothetical protein